MAKGLFLILFCLCSVAAGTMCYAAGAKLTQSTSGDKSPAVHAGRDATITYNDDVKGRIIDKLTEIAQKCKNKDVNINDLKPELEAIALYKKTAIPLILSFASSYMDVNIDSYSPDFLTTYREKLTHTVLYDALIYAVRKIYADDPDSRKYLTELYSNPYESIKKQKEALVFGYYLWRLPAQDTEGVLATWLKGRPVCDMDPIKKVMLRTYLHNNRNEIFSFGKGTIQKHNIKISDDNTYLIKKLEFEGVENGPLFVKHLKDYFYESLEDMESDIGVRSLVIPDIKRKLGKARGSYAYGFDFYDISVNNVVMDDVLLGKSSFEKAALNNFVIIGSTLVDCNFSKSFIQNGWFDDAYFLGAKLDNSTVTWGTNHTVIANSMFKEADISRATFVSVDFLNVKFDKCKVSGTGSNSIFRSILFLNVDFTECDPNKLDFDDVIIDEKSLNTIQALPGFDKSKFIIKKINVSREIIDNYNDFDKRTKDVDESLRVMRLVEGLSSLKRKPQYYENALSIIEHGAMYCINSKHEETVVTPDVKYAYVVSMIDKCREIFPEESVEFDNAKVVLGKFIEGKKNFEGVANNPKIKTTIKEAKSDIDMNMKNVENFKDIRITCEKLKRGKFNVLDRQ